MTATKQQQQLAKGTSWLAQLRVNAEYAECDASALAQERFNKTLDTLTLEEAQTLVWELNGILNHRAEAEKAARVPVSGPHSHECITCGRAVDCFRDECREVTSEHRYCHEGYGPGEWVTYHRKLGEKY
ncbi:MAG: hypothetical protein ACLGJB_10805 [Blastocatellia bacterium]